MHLPAHSQSGQHQAETAHYSSEDVFDTSDFDQANDADFTNHEQAAHHPSHEGRAKQEAFRQRRTHLDRSARQGKHLDSPSRSIPYTSEEESYRKPSLGERAVEACPPGKTFYRCANGFMGCCAHDPCNPNGSCRDGDRTSSKDSEKATTSAGKVSGETASAIMQHMSSSGSTTRDITSGIDSGASSTGSSSLAKTAARSTASQTSNTAMLAPPACPGGDNTLFTDSSNIAYRVHCHTANSYAFYDTVDVAMGGYAECFSACSKTSDCAGFTYVGLKSGICHLKSHMPRGMYVVKPPGSAYVSCSKTDVNAEASGTSSSATTTTTSTPSSSATSTNTNTGNTSSKTNIGAIVGGVLGALVFLILVLFLIAICAKRKRKKIEQKRATIITHMTHGPIETSPQYASAPAQHVRSASTSHDIFAPFGGFYRGTGDVFADPSAKNKTRDDAASPLATNKARDTWRSGDITIMPPASYRYRAAPEGIPMEPRIPPFVAATGGGGRSPRFHEHIAELEDTASMATLSSIGSLSRSVSTMDSPTLGRGPLVPMNGRLLEGLRRQRGGMGNQREVSPEEEGSAFVKGGGLVFPPNEREQRC